MKRFSRQELAKYNGRDGYPAYVAHNGGVYDVSTSALWMNGKHQAVHFAGEDLTGAMKNAPHSPDLLEKFPLVGTLRAACSIAGSKD
ncbi:MAG: cytochrome b5 domain-containing protein [Candidatus Bathyarchaeia archaeon]